MKMRVQYISKTVKGKIYSYPFLVHSYRDEKGKPRNKVIENLSHLPENAVGALKEALNSKSEVKLISAESVVYKKSVSIGSECVVLELIKDLGIIAALGNFPINFKNTIIASIVDRVINPKPYSKKMLSKTFTKSFVGKLLNCVEDIPEQNWYESLEYLSTEQSGIEKKLFGKDSGSLFLYDITSSYFEGEVCPIAEFGYNRDEKKGKKQIVIGLLTNSKGKPVSVEVFKGNTADQTTVIGQISKLMKLFGLKEVTFVGDRGMLTSKRINEIEEDKKLESIKYITAITRGEIIKLSEDKSHPMQYSLFDHRDMVEVEEAGKRYVLCKNPSKQKEDDSTRNILINKTKNKLDAIFTSIAEKKLKNKEIIGKRVNSCIKKWNVGYLFDIEYEESYLSYEINKEKLDKARLLDGCYVLTTNLSTEEISKEGIVEKYRDLQKVEQAFKSIKTTDIFLRPIRHWNEARVKGHVFVCMLAYMVIWEAKQRLKEYLKNDKQPDSVSTIREIWNSLNQISIGTIDIAGKERHQLSSIDKVQKEILKHSKVIINKKVVNIM